MAGGLVSVAALSAVSVLSGCSTTQQEAARLQLNSARIRASEARTRVTVPAKSIRVTKLAVITSGRRSAFIVRIVNRGSRPVSDLPISVGVRVGAKPRIYLNALSPLEYSYFDAHLPLVPAAGALTWVYTTNRRLPARGRPFAIVGATASPVAPGADHSPVIQAKVVAAGGSAASGVPPASGGSRLSVAVRNTSSIPQYQLQVYAVARRGGHYVAAGQLTVAHLGSQKSQTLRLDVLGSLDRAHLQVQALPTIFQ